MYCRFFFYWIATLIYNYSTYALVLHNTHLYLVCLVSFQSQDLVLGQKVEEGKQMKQDLQRAQSLFTSAERELRYEKEKNLDLKKHNTLLDQEKLKVSTYT